MGWFKKNEKKKTGVLQTGHLQPLKRKSKRKQFHYKVEVGLFFDGQQRGQFPVNVVARNRAEVRKKLAEFTLQDMAIHRVKHK